VAVRSVIHLKSNTFSCAWKVHKSVCALLTANWGGGHRSRYTDQFACGSCVWCVAYLVCAKEVFEFL